MSKTTQGGWLVGRKKVLIYEVVRKSNVKNLTIKSFFFYNYTTLFLQTIERDRVVI